MAARKQSGKGTDAPGKARPSRPSDSKPRARAKASRKTAASKVVASVIGEEQPRRALLVLGMHRSGTSALAGSLGLAGAALPGHLMEPNDANARGFFESQRLYELHEQLLDELNCSWSDVCLPRSGIAGASSASPWVDRLAGAVRSEFGEAPLFVVKDPRICRLVPLWSRVLGQLGVEPSYVLIVRNPLEVAASLQRQHSIDTGSGLLLWLDHVLRSEQDTRGARRVVVTYESLLEDWRAVLGRVQESLELELPRLSRRTEAEIDRFLSTSLRREQVVEAAVYRREDVVDWVKATWSWAQRANGGEYGPAVELDVVADALAGAEHAFGPVLASAQLSARDARAAAAELRTALDDARQEYNRRDEELSKTQSELVRTRGEVTLLEERLETHAAQLAATRQESAQRGASMAAKQTELELAREDTERLQLEIDTLRTDRARATGELEAALRDGEQLRASLDATRAEADQLRAHRNEAERLGALLEAAREEAARLQGTQQEAASLRAELELRSEELERLRATEQEAASLRAELDAGRAELGRLRATEQEAASLRAELALHRDEAERLREAHEETLRLRAVLDEAREQADRLRGEVEERDRQANDLFSWLRTVLPQVAERVSGRDVAPDVAGEIFEALEAAAPSERASAATASLQAAVRAARIDELEEALSTLADEHAEKVLSLDEHAARLRAQCHIALERAERRERELAETIEAHARASTATEARHEKVLQEAVAREQGAVAECAERARELVEANDRAAVLREQLRAAEADRADLGLLAEQLKLQIHAIQRSKTWRWTTPLRRAGEWLRR